jgi:endonuclease-3
MDSSPNARKKRAAEILAILQREYPDARVHLHFRNAFELLAATILAAQCTDERVNQVTPALFARYPEPASLAAAEQGDLEALIRSTGFYRNKARSLLGMARALSERFGGKVPETIEELITVPGVGRKTANVLIGACFGAPAIVVDTHLKRVTARLALTAESDPDRIEADLRAIIPEKNQTRFSWLIGEHRRRTCVARKPLCERCSVRRLCPFPDKSRKPDRARGRAKK